MADFDAQNYPALAIRPPAMPTASPMETLGQFANIQNALNQNRLFQQTFAAQQTAGQILAAAPDLDTGIANLTRDPRTAAFAGPIINNIRQAQQTTTTIRGLRQTQSLDLTKAALAQLGPAVYDPSKFIPLASGVLASGSPEATPQATATLQSIHDAWTEGLNPNSAAWSPQEFATYQKRAIASLVGSGALTETAAKQLLPSAATQNTGGQTVFGAQAPGWQGGAFRAASTLPMTLAPTVVTGPFGPDGAIQPVVLGGGGSLGQDGPPGPGPGPSGAAVPTGPSQVDTAANAARGTAAGNIAEDLIDQGKGLPNAIRRLDIMTDTLSHFQAGGGADMRTQFAQGLQAIKNSDLPLSNHITQEMIDTVGNNSLSDSQLFEAEVKPLATAELKEAAQGTGRVMKSEVDAFLGMMDRTKDPKALMALLNQARAALATGYDQAVKYPQFKAALAAKSPSVAGMDQGDFYTWYNENYNQLPKAAGGQNLSPVPASNAQGAGPSHRWNPATRKIEPIQ